MEISKPYMDIFKQGLFFGLDRLFDCCLRTEDGLEFGVHRVILATRCEYFRALFCGNFRRGTNAFLPGVNGNILCEILRFLYTGSLNLNEENIIDVIIAADYLLVDNLLNECRIYAFNHITPNNCLVFLKAAWLVERFSFLTECFRFAQIHFESVVNNPASKFADLPLCFVKSFLNLNGITEDTVWMAAMTWLKDDPVGRIQALPELLSCLRLQNLDEPLATEILENPLVKEYLFSSEPQNSLYSKNSGINEDLFCTESANNNNNNDFAKLESLISKSKIIYSSCPPPSRSRLPKRLFVFSGSTSQFSFNKKFYITFDEELDIWREVGEASIWPQALIPVGSIVYMFDEFENKVLALNLEDRSWTQVNPMNIPRQEYSVVEIGLNIYVLGGTIFSSHVHTSLVEKYDCRTGLWEDASSMLPMNRGIAIGADNVIYAVGIIQNGRDFEMIAQVYDPILDTWSLISAPNIYRINFALLFVRGNIYILGGTDNGDYLRSVEEYDPEEDIWKPFMDLPFPYYAPKAVVFKDMILVYDDISQGNYSPYPPSYWDEKLQNWQLLGLVPLSMYKFCALKDENAIKNLVRKSSDPHANWKKSPFANPFLFIN